MTQPALRDRILVVDDSPTNVSILMTALENEYEVSFANSGQEALTLVAESERPDLILLDVMMPEMDGYEVCRRLKANPATREIPVIFVTAMDSTESESIGLTLGAEDYITKPMNLGIARLRIRNLLERRRLYRDLELSMASARQGLWSWELEADQVLLDQRWAEPLGYAAHEMTLMPRPWADLVHPTDLPGLAAACQAHLAGATPSISAEVRMRNKHDAFVWVQILGRALPASGQGSPLRVVGTYLDISQRKHDEARLSAQQEHLRTLLNSIPDIVLSVDTDAVLTDLHLPAIHQPLLRRPDWSGQPCAAVLPEELASVLEAGMRACFEDARSHTFECQIDIDGGPRHFSATVSRLVSQSEWPSGFLAVIRDVTEIRKAEEELRRLAFHDPLTGLANRRLLEDRLHQAKLFAGREHAWAAVMLLDLDKFKELNDRHGHDSGDQLLIETARRLRNAVREIDTVARLGGDEFVVILERLGPDEAEAGRTAQTIATKIVADLEREYDLGKIQYRCPVSIGVKLFSGDTDIGIAELLEDADAAMYRNKQQRRDAASV